MGLALTVGGIAGIVAQTPAGALVDFIRSKRTMMGMAVAALAAGALVLALLPSFWPVMSAQVFIGSTSSVFGPHRLRDVPRNRWTRCIRRPPRTQSDVQRVT